MFAGALKYVQSTGIKSSYDIARDPSFQSGSWKVYDATRKGAGRDSKRVSVFIFEKKLLESAAFGRPTSTSALRSRQDAVFARLKQEVSMLARLRHPSILELVEPLEETRNTYIFATEHLTASLSSQIGKGKEGRRRRSDLQLDDLEIQKGLLQLSKALQFLHGSANMVHLNLVPESILVNTKGDWKLAGLGFAQNIAEAQYEFPEIDPRVPQSVQMNMDFLAPEYVLDQQVDCPNDMFSLGCLIVAIHNHGESPINAHQNTQTYRKQTNDFNALNMGSVPSHLAQVLPQLFTRRPSNRLSATAFETSSFFDNILMRTIRFLDAFPEKTASEKQSFMRGLLAVLSQFPERTLQRKILPSLLTELKDRDLAQYTIPNILAISSKMHPEAFEKQVLPSLEPLFSTDCGPGILMAFLEKLEILKDKTTSEGFKNGVMKLIYAGLSCDTPYVQDKSLSYMPLLNESLDFSTIKTALFPKVAQLFQHTTTLSIKIATITSFRALLKNLDKYTMNEKLIPLLKGIRTKEPDVMMAVLRLHEDLGARADIDQVAEHIIPQLWSMSLGPLLNAKQFGDFIKVIKSLGNKVEQEQRKKLVEVDTSRSTAQDMSASKLSNGQSPPPAVEFERLVLGKTNIGAAPNPTEQPSQTTNFAWSHTSQPDQPKATGSFSVMQPMSPNKGPSTSQTGGPYQSPHRWGKPPVQDDFGEMKSAGFASNRWPSTSSVSNRQQSTFPNAPPVSNTLPRLDPPNQGSAYDNDNSLL